MGIGGFLARKGNIGGTARWAGKLYLSIKKKERNKNINEIMKSIVSIRYAGSQEENALNLIIDKGEMRGLQHLVTNILSIEAGFNENTQENRFMFMDIIREELEKLNIPDSDIYKI